MKSLFPCVLVRGLCAILATPVYGFNILVPNGEFQRLIVMKGSGAGILELRFRNFVFLFHYLRRKGQGRLKPDVPSKVIWFSYNYISEYLQPSSVSPVRVCLTVITWTTENCTEEIHSGANKRPTEYICLQRSQTFWVITDSREEGRHFSTFTHHTHTCTYAHTPAQGSQPLILLLLKRKSLNDLD